MLQKLQLCVCVCVCVCGGHKRTCTVEQYSDNAAGKRGRDKLYFAPSPNEAQPE